jgi:hypothetical protein
MAYKARFLALERLADGAWTAFERPAPRASGERE